MSKYFLALLSLLFCCVGFRASGQEELSGLIYSQAGEPVAFANIYNLQSKRGTSSDLGGRFRLSAKAGDSLRISFIGYESQFRVLSVADFLKPIRIILKENSYLLREVVIRDEYELPVVYRRKSRRQAVEGLPYIADPKPIEAGSSSWGNQVSDGAPLDAVGLNATIYGPISFFSKGEREKRKLKKATKATDETAVYNAMMARPETNALLREEFQLSQAACDSLLSRFNQEQAHVARLSSEYQIWERLLQYFRLSLEPKED